VEKTLTQGSGRQKQLSAHEEGEKKRNLEEELLKPAWGGGINRREAPERETKQGPITLEAKGKERKPKFSWKKNQSVAREDKQLSEGEKADKKKLF